MHYLPVCKIAEKIMSLTATRMFTWLWSFGKNISNWLHIDNALQCIEAQGILV